MSEALTNDTVHNMRGGAVEFRMESLPCDSDSDGNAKDTSRQVTAPLTLITIIVQKFLKLETAALDNNAHHAIYDICCARHLFSVPKRRNGNGGRQMINFELS